MLHWASNSHCDTVSQGQKEAKKVQPAFMPHLHLSSSVRATCQLVCRQLGKTNMRGERIYEGNHSRGVVADPAALARAAIVVLARSVQTLCSPEVIK